MSEYAIDLSDVAKTYRGKVQALRGIEMRVNRGEVFGLLGPNGAGKSTLVKILMTVIRPTRCTGTLLGDPVGRKSTLASVGYLPEHHKFPDYLTGAQTLDFFGAMSKVPRVQRRRRAGELLELVGMAEWSKKKLGGYSKGMRQRIGIAQALINDPELVLLDEPTDGVDPVGRRDIRDILARLKDEGKTVFLNSHLLSELEMVCDRVSILVQGRVQSQGTIDELTIDQRHYDLGVAPENRARALDLAKGVFGDAVRPLDGSAHAGIVRIDTFEADRVQPVLDAVRGAGITIRSVTPYRPSLEDLFMAAITDESGHELKPGAGGDAR